jgi:hypothetical protein
MGLSITTTSGDNFCCCAHSTTHLASIQFFTILLKLRTSYRLFTKVKSNKVMVSSRYKLELIIHYVVRSGQSSIMLVLASGARMNSQLYILYNYI